MSYVITEALEKVATTPNSRDIPRGVINKFIAVNQEWGIKFTRHESKRDEGYLRQYIASCHGLAPQVGDKVEFGWDDEQQFGFFTETCPYLAKDAGYGERNDWLMENQVKWHDFKAKLRELGINFNDDHSGNWGWMDKPCGEQLVCIDFGKDDGLW